MKKTIAFLLLLVMILSLSACGSSGSGSNTQGNTPGNTQGNAQGNSQGSTQGKAWYETLVKDEEEFDLRDSYYLPTNTLHFNDGKVTREIYIKDKDPITQTGTYTRDKNVVTCDINGSKVVYRLIGSGIVNVTENVYAADASISNAENPIVREELKNIDFSKYTEPVFLNSDGRRYLVAAGHVCMDFELSSFNGNHIDSVEIPSFNHGHSFSGIWSDKYVESVTNRFATYAEYENIYKWELDFELKMLEYIVKYKDTNPLCICAYYTMESRGSGSRSFGFSYSKTLENIGGLYWTMGKTEQAKEMFAKVPNLDEYLKDRYSRNVVINEYHMVIEEPEFSGSPSYTTDENGLVLKITEKNKVTEFKYDSEGRLIYTWVKKDSAYKYEYLDGKLAVHSVFLDRYNKPLQDNYVYELVNGKRGTMLEETPRTTEMPSWVKEIPAGLK